jgi:hypothetical protein
MGPLLSAEPQRPSHILEVVDYDAAHVESVDQEEMFPNIRAAGATIKCIKSAGVYYDGRSFSFLPTIGPIIPFPQKPCP